MTIRDEFSEKTKKILQERVGNMCSNPDCQSPTSGPNTAELKATRIGVAAHITAAAPNGPRYDQSLTQEQRKHISNGIWLCQNCAKLIDADPDQYLPETLRGWKSKSENRARLSLEGREVSSKVIENGLTCTHCNTVAKFGTKVCLGCGAEIYYGLTSDEFRAHAEEGAFFGFFTPLILLIFYSEVYGPFSTQTISIPILIEDIGYKFLFTCVVFAILGAVFHPVISERYQRKKDPRFIRQRKV